MRELSHWPQFVDAGARISPATHPLDGRPRPTPPLPDGRHPRPVRFDALVIRSAPTGLDSRVAQADGELQQRCDGAGDGSLSLLAQFSRQSFYPGERDELLARKHRLTSHPRTLAPDTARCPRRSAELHLCAVARRRIRATWLSSTCRTRR